MARKTKYKYEIKCYYMNDELDENEIHKFETEDGAKFEAQYLARYYDKVLIFYIGGKNEPEVIAEYVNKNGRIHHIEKGGK